MMTWSKGCCVLPVFTNPTTQAALITVHGAWDEWSPWSLCSSTCGRGFRSRTRTCTPPQFGGDPCDGPEKQTKFCNIAVCPGKQHTGMIGNHIWLGLFGLANCASVSQKHSWCKQVGSNSINVSVANGKLNST